MRAVSLIAIATICALLVWKARRWLWWRIARIEAGRRRPVRFVCPSCVRNLRLNANFCHRCGTPVSGYAATGPIEYVATEGEMYRRAVSRPSGIAVVGLWLIAAPGTLLVLLEVIEAKGKLPLESLAWLPIAFLPVFIAAKATRRYSLRPNAPDPGAARSENA